MGFREEHIVKRVLASLMCIAMLSMTAMGVAAAAPTPVMESDITRQAENTPPTDNWVLYTRGDGTGAFVQGPVGQPLGIGSLQLNTPTGADKVFLFNYDHIGTPLADIDAVGYSTYRVSGDAPNQVPAINIEVDYNGTAPGGFTTLVFEPVYNTDQGSIVDGTWQTWDSFNEGNAVWWSTKNIPGVCAFNCFIKWSDIVAANPDATILGGFGVNQGSGNPGLDASVDALTFGASGDSVTYDFEPSLQPTSKDDCKHGGWQTFNNPVFSNQGECVSWVNHNQ
jgi:hypothetical protein